jgi:hypothetical protein
MIKCIKYLSKQSIARTLNASEPAKSALAKLETSDITGTPAEKLNDGVLLAGQHHIARNAKDPASGICLYKLITDNNFQTRKAVLIT